jgi:hypothetical protein
MREAAGGGPEISRTGSFEHAESALAKSSAAIYECLFMVGYGWVIQSGLV